MFLEKDKTRSSPIEEDTRTNIVGLIFFPSLLAYRIATESDAATPSTGSKN